MSEATGAQEAEEFATLLRELKDRSGLSYGALAKRLHTSRVDAAPLLQRHRDPERLRAGGAPRAGVPGDAAGTRRTAPALDPGGRGTRAQGGPRHGGPGHGGAGRGGRLGRRPRGTGRSRSGRYGPGRCGGRHGPGCSCGGRHGPGRPRRPRCPGRRSRRPERAPAGRCDRRCGVAGTPVAATLGAGFPGAATLLAAPPSHRADRLRRDGRRTGGRGACRASAVGGRERRARPAGGARRREHGRGRRQGAVHPAPGGHGGTPSVSASVSAGRRPRLARHGDRRPRCAAVPLELHTTPYFYDQADPCMQHFLVDSEPGHVGPPPNEESAQGWAAAYGGVASDEQEVAVTLQGTGANTVVLEAMHVDVVAEDPPLAWNDYAMGDGCGGDVTTKSFDIDLDNAEAPPSPPRPGQGDFPYRSASPTPRSSMSSPTQGARRPLEPTLDWRRRRPPRHRPHRQRRPPVPHLRRRRPPRLRLSARRQRLDHTRGLTRRPGQAAPEGSHRTGRPEAVPDERRARAPGVDAPHRLARQNRPRPRPGSGCAGGVRAHVSHGPPCA